MNKKIIFIILTAFVFRLLFVFTAYHGDLNNNISWGDLAVERGLLNFYEGINWPFSAPNQPPLYVLLYGFTSLVWRNVESLSWWLNNNVPSFPSAFIWFWESKGMTLVAKLPSILADLGIGLLIYKYFKKLKKEKVGTNLLLVWLFNPVVWYNSTVWGQTDPIVNFLGIAAILFLIDRKIVLSFLLLTLSILFKGSLIIFLPIIVLLSLYQKHKYSIWIKAGLASIVSVYLISFWFHPQLDFPIWLFNLYSNRIFPGEIGYLSANAFNLWWLINSGNVLDSEKYLGIAYRSWGFVMFGLTYLVSIFYFIKSKFNSKIFLFTLAFIALTSFMFMTRMHERYLYPFIPIATLLLGFIPELIIIYVLFSLTYVVNLYHLFWIPSIPWLEVNFSMLNIGTITAILNLLLLAYFFFIFARRKESI